MSCVLDNSVAMRWFFPSEKSSENVYALKIRSEILDGLIAIVPPIFEYEASNILWKLGKDREGILQDMRALKTLIKADGYPKKLLEIAIQFSCQYKLSTYDASYLALADLTNSSLATLDKDLSKAAKKAGITLA